MLISIPTLELHIKLLRETIQVIRDPAPDRSARRLRTITKLRDRVSQLQALILAHKEAYRPNNNLTEHPDGPELKP